MIHLGINLHSTNMVNSAINDDGHELLKTKLPTSEQSLREFFDGFDEPVQAVVECTGFWYWLADWCQANDIPLVLGPC